MSNLHFSWSDSLQAALSSCLFCFGSSETDGEPYGHDHVHDIPRSRNNGLLNVVPPPRARPDELEGLLADSDSGDAETMSLHSNIGDDRRRRKRRRPRKGIRVFGYNLFGRPPIHLPESDDEEEGHSGRRARTISSSTLDSDAAPLDPSVLDGVSVARLAAATAAAEEEQRRAKEERRRLRRERKELKRMAMAMAMGMQPGGEQGFEGFPGSGPGFHASGPGSGSGSMSATSSPFAEEFGAFAHGQSATVFEDDVDADGADFGAESYARRTPHGTASGGTGSDSLSRTSASNSNGDAVHHNHQVLSMPQYLPPPTEEDSQKRKRRRSTRTKSLSSRQSDSPSLPTSQSPSIPSPSADHTSFSHPDVVLSPHAESNFEGFQGGTLDLAREHANARDGAKGPDSPFPSVGLLGVKRTNSDMGVFLARRGDE